MSTFYIENPMTLEKLENHYTKNGETATVWGTLSDFEDSDVGSAVDVFIEDTETCIVTKIAEDDFVAYYMNTSTFREEWSEKVWAKFRADMNDTVCPHCGKQMAHSVAGKTLSDIGKINQFYCEECGYGWIGYPSGKFIREGVLYSEWEIPR